MLTRSGLSGDREHLPRYALPAEAIAGGQVRFPAPLARRLRQRGLGAGDRVAVFDGGDVEYVVSLVSLRPDGALGIVEQASRPAVEPRLRIDLLLALLPGGRFEAALAMATELGVASVTPLVCEENRALAARIDTAQLARWQEVAARAAERSGRLRLPTVEAPCPFAATLPRLEGQPALLAWEPTTSLSAAQAFSALERRLRGGRVLLLVGPDEGFTHDEALAARRAGAVTISLGSRTLSAENAASLLVGLALYHAGDLEPPR